MPAAMRSKFSPDDILQEVYLDVFQQISRFEYRGPGSFINWIFTILDRKIAATWRAAHTKVRDMDREVSFRPKPDESSYWSLLDQVYADSATPSRAIRREEAFTTLVACLSDLSENHRQVIQLRFLEGAAVSEVAKRLGRSEGAVVALTKRALVALRESMDNMGDFTRGA
jgi:RNA polymerase sigma-70 factor (ECF subfamily)